MRKRYFAALCFNASLVLAQPPAGYYNSASGLTAAPLKMALHNIIKGHTSVTYAGLWTAFDSTDVKPNGQVWDIYSDVPGGTPPYTYTYQTDQCGNYNGEGDCYNREHSWPESWFNGVAGPYTDLFHIYPTDGWVNNKRGDYPYGEVSNPTYTSLNGGKLGPNTSTGYNLTVFEPVNEYKGDLARGYFYMSTRYMNEDSAWGSSDAVAKSILKPWAVCLLLKWHKQDPVSAKEINRNNAVYKIQHNRNPFIDHPEWADSVFNCTLTSINRLADQSLRIEAFPNPAKNELHIVLPEKMAMGSLHIYNCLGEEMLMTDLQTNALTLDISGLNKGMYVLGFSCGNMAGWQKILID